MGFDLKVIRVNLLINVALETLSAIYYNSDTRDAFRCAVTLSRNVIIITRHFFTLRDLYDDPDYICVYLRRDAKIPRCKREISCKPCLLYGGENQRYVRMDILCKYVKQSTMLAVKQIYT